MTTIADLRAQIDELDQELIALLAQRARIVHQIGSLKTSTQEIIAVERQQLVYQTRRQWAAEHGLDPDFVEALYRAMITHFIEQEKKQLAERE